MKTNTLLSSLSCPRRVCLTGTPVQNDLKEFFAIADFAVSGALGSAALFAKVLRQSLRRSLVYICARYIHLTDLDVLRVEQRTMALTHGS